MQLDTVIKNRRSIRHFLKTPVPRDVLESVFSAAIEAPSPKNAQPWSLVVFQETPKDELVKTISKLVNEEYKDGHLHPGVLETVNVMKQAPVIVLVYNRATDRYEKEVDPVVARMIDVQSIGACIQNLLLTAYENNLGTLWICDLLDVISVKRMLENELELVAALAIGYTNVDPPRPPRRTLNETVTWISV